MQTAHAALQAKDVAKPLWDTLRAHWPVLLGAAFFSIGASGPMPRKGRNYRRQREVSANKAATQRRSIRIPLSLSILAVSIILCVWRFLAL